MIKPDFLEELDRFNVALKKHSVENRQGEQSSGAKGEGMVFEDHKKYVPGDDIRRIDWKAYARTENYFVKRFEEEKSVTVHILIDRSSSMDYGNPRKYDIAGMLGVGLAYMAGNTNNRFRLSVFSETVTDISSARRNARLGGIIEILNQLPQTPESLLERCMLEYDDRIKNKSIVVVISDFLMEMQQIENAVERMDSTELLLVNVLDQTELVPDFMGDFILDDAESDSSIRTFISDWTRSRYQKELDAHTGRIQEIAKEHGAKYIKLSTADDFFDSFLSVWNLLNR